MKADKTLVAGAAATVQKTLDMSGTFKGMAEVQLQQMQAVNNIFTRILFIGAHGQLSIQGRVVFHIEGDIILH